MSSASWALQAAIFAALSADAGVQALLGNPPRLYDAVPALATFPYAVIGDGGETNWDTATEQGTEHQLTLDVWSRAGGHKEAKAVAEAIRESLQTATLSPDGHTLIDLRYLDCAFARETDGETFRASLHFRAVTEPL